MVYRQSKPVRDPQALQAEIEKVQGEMAERGRQNDIQDGLVPEDTPPQSS